MQSTQAGPCGPACLVGILTCPAETEREIKGEINLKKIDSALEISAD